MPGRPCITPGHPLTNRERVARHRAAHPKPKPPPHQEGPFVLRTFGEVAASLLPEPPKPPERKFDPEAMITVGDPVLPAPDPGFGFMK